MPYIPIFIFIKNLIFLCLFKKNFPLFLAHNFLIGSTHKVVLI